MTEEEIQEAFDKISELVNSDQEENVALAPQLLESIRSIGVWRFKDRLNKMRNEYAELRRVNFLESAKGREILKFENVLKKFLKNEHKKI
jgi:hypothetical protein